MLTLQVPYKCKYAYFFLNFESAFSLMRCYLSGTQHQHWHVIQYMAAEGGGSRGQQLPVEAADGGGVGTGRGQSQQRPPVAPEASA